MNFVVAYNAGKFLTIGATVSFAMMTAQWSEVV
jgi:hypothetical protein